MAKRKFLGKWLPLVKEAQYLPEKKVWYVSDGFVLLIIPEGLLEPEDVEFLKKICHRVDLVKYVEDVQKKTNKKLEFAFHILFDPFLRKPYFKSKGYLVYMAKNLFEIIRQSQPDLCLSKKLDDYVLRNEFNYYACDGVSPVVVYRRDILGENDGDAIALTMPMTGDDEKWMEAQRKARVKEDKI